MSGLIINTQPGFAVLFQEFILFNTSKLQVIPRHRDAIVVFARSFYFFNSLLSPQLTGIRAGPGLQSTAGPPPAPSDCGSSPALPPSSSRIRTSVRGGWEAAFTHSSLSVSNELYTDNIAFRCKNPFMRQFWNIPNHRSFKTFYIWIGHCHLPQTQAALQHAEE